MFQNVSQSYTLADASSEIALMLLGAFVLGMMFGWLLKPSKSDDVDEEQDIKSTGVQSGAEDDLQMIEGVGPAIEKLLIKYGVQSFKDVVNTDVSGLEEILEEGGTRFKKHVPTTWPDQARLADAGKWTELEEYQDILNRGK